MKPNMREKSDTDICTKYPLDILIIVAKRLVSISRTCLSFLSEQDYVAYDVIIVLQPPSVTDPVVDLTCMG
jgi:hypothetical protein